MNYVYILPKMDASVAEYSGSFTCIACNKSGIDYPYLDRPKLVGWCDTDWGYMMIVECPHCFAKYRFHGTAVNQQDLTSFEAAIRSYIIAEYFSNSEKLFNTRKEE